jgi:lipooligosaccharide transport system permease protein
LLTIVALGFGLGDFIELETRESYIEFIGPGILAAYAMWMASAEACWGAYFRIDQKTFDAILSTPASVDDVTSGEVLWASTRAFISIVCIFIVVLVFGAIDSVLALLILPLAVLPGMLFGAVSLCYAAVARSVSSLNYFFAAFITPQFWLAGVFFPLDSLPRWVQSVAWFTPLFHVVEVYRGLSTGDPELVHLANIAWMAVVTAAFYALAITLMRRRLVK